METVDLLTIIVYFTLLVGVGFIFNRLNKNKDDYFRGGCKGTWWLVGMSSFMLSFSAWTFTGAAGAAYEAGWSVMIVFWAGSMGYFVAAACLAPWFRQLRIYAGPQVYELRWHKPLARFSFYAVTAFHILTPGIWLYGMAIFTSAMFGFDVVTLILVLGTVVLVYSMGGGLWGVMATDFLQGVILLPVTVLITVLCLIEVGGIGGFFGMIEAQGLTDDYTMIKERGWSPVNEYTWLWAIALTIGQINNLIGLGNALRYNSVKDGRGARQAALFAGILLGIGAFVWFVPPITARLLYADQVLAVAVAKPAEASYGIAALNLLPAGLRGLMVVAIFSATMSSMDTGLNRLTASFFHIFVPDFCKIFRLPTPESDRSQLLLSRLITLCLGVAIITIALVFARSGEGVFDIFLSLKAFLVGISILGIWGLFFRRAPLITPYLCIVAGIISGILTMSSERIFGFPMNFQTRFFINFGIPSLMFFACIPFYEKYSSPKFKSRVDAFFTRMKTPVDFEKEVGAPEDITQLITIGRFSAIIALFIACLSVTSESISDLVSILSLAAVVGLFAGFLWRAGVRSKRRLIVHQEIVEDLPRARREEVNQYE